MIHGSTPSTCHLAAVGRTVVDLDIRRDHLEAVVADRTDLVGVAVGRSLVEEHHSLEGVADQVEHRNPVVAVGHSLGAAVGHSLAVAADRSLVEARHIDQVVHRSLRALGWSSRPWNRSFGQ